MDEARSRGGVRGVGVALGVGVLVVIAVVIATRRQTANAECDLDELTSRAPDIEHGELDDAHLLAAGSEALTSVLESCASLNGYTRYWMAHYAASWAGEPSTSFMRDGPPAEVLDLRRRTCPVFDELWLGDLRDRERGLVMFDACGLRQRGVLDDRDVEYVDPGWPSLWSWHLLLLESGLDEESARRYALAFMLAAEVDRRTGQEIEVHGSAIRLREAYETEAQTIELALEPTRERQIADLFAEHGGDCWLREVSLPADEEMGALEWLFSPKPNRDDNQERRGRGCLDKVMNVAIIEREALLRPLRAQIDFPDPEATPALDLLVDRGGSWRVVDGQAGGRGPEELRVLLDQRSPASVRLRVARSVRAKTAIDLAREVDVWRARGKRDVKLWLVADHETKGGRG